jgi:hypothetical protein
MEGLSYYAQLASLTSGFASGTDPWIIPWRGSPARESCLQQSNYLVTLQGGIWKSHSIASVNRRVPERFKFAGGPEGLTGQSLMMIRHTVVVGLRGPSRQLLGLGLTAGTSDPLPLGEVINQMGFVWQLNGWRRPSGPQASFPPDTDWRLINQCP